MKKVFIYPKQFNFEQYMKDDILNISLYKWKKYKLFHIVKTLYEIPLFNSYLLYKKYYFLDKDHMIEEYDISSLNISEIFNIIVGIFGMKTQVQIKNYFTMVGNSQNLFTLYNYCIVQYNDMEIIESMFPTFDLENEKPEINLIEVKNGNRNVQKISTGQIEISTNEITKIDEQQKQIQLVLI